LRIEEFFSTRRTTISILRSFKDSNLYVGISAIFVFCWVGATDLAKCWSYINKDTMQFCNTKEKESQGEWDPCMMGIFNGSVTWEEMH
jgi:hypothetical protein